MYECEILADSMSPANIRLTTFEITFPRFVLAEFNTHRMISRNAASNRAIPVYKRIQQVRQDPFIPDTFGKNQRGMVAEQNLSSKDSAIAEQVWREGLEKALSAAEELNELGVHKEYANRLLEPYSWVTVIATATDWQHFFDLRCAPDAQPEIRRIALMMQSAHRINIPIGVKGYEWHLPFIDDDDRDRFDIGNLILIAVGRCARVSYLTHNGIRDPQKDIELAHRLVDDNHLSPFEHCAVAMIDNHNDIYGMNDIYASNLRGWMSARTEMERLGILPE